MMMQISILKGAYSDLHLTFITFKGTYLKSYLCRTLYGCRQSKSIAAFLFESRQDMVTDGSDGSPQAFSVVPLRPRELDVPFLQIRACGRVP